MREARVMSKLDNLKQRIENEIAIATEQDNEQALQVLSGLKTEVEEIEAEESCRKLNKKPLADN
jgi:hypothetical protein